MTIEIFVIYLVCFVLFPVSVLCGFQAKDKLGSMLTKEETDIIKGIATCFVIFAHLVNLLETAKVDYFVLLNLYSVTGGMGVLLFFFVSGYGIYKGYGYKKPTVSFLKKRLANVLIPYVILKLSFLVIELAIGMEMLSLKDFLFRFISDWFIDVILIQYLFFYLAWKISNIERIVRKKTFFICSFAFNAIVAIVFWKFDFNARWYNGLFLFPIGMLIANFESELINLWNKKWKTGVCINLLMFLLLGLVFTANKGALWADGIKTIAGIFFALLICQFLLRFDMNSKVMQYIGRKSLYYYIAHLSIMSILSRFTEVEATNAFFLVWGLTWLAVVLLATISNMIIRKFKIALCDGEPFA